MTTALQHIESRALYMITTLNIPDTIEKADRPLSCEEIKTIIDEEMGYDPLDTSYLCHILHAAHFDLLSETSDDKYSLTPSVSTSLLTILRVLRDLLNYTQVMSH
ncbi:PREDICTED: uncharacterized protein LOC109590946 [Amphimedon queenslandica]|uniref:O-methyltransferase dimerisation domain-containing protein n=2 Tax=Amphimedon queenslandica TaxID=400682 RepID=A0AAN0JYP1_AMPQE|nr:PREDICTED: uncharacterized protein LOC109590946 [Amphimedon queenslandica]|eukprot:XP_019862342.1 PREDICTED: uncharacterized protein LOC109590946 [Amphimedon queenslandica]